MTPFAAKALVALCLCPPAVMTAMVATSPPARSHAIKAVRHALRQTPPRPRAPAAPAAVASAPLTGGCENLPKLAALAEPFDTMASLPAATLANPAIGASNALPAGLGLNLSEPLGSVSFVPAAPVISNLLPVSGVPDLGQWAQMMVGFGLIASTIRVRRRSQA
jgi:hypothetical protein